MDSSAIQTIRDMAIIHSANDTDLPIIVIPDNHQVVALEKYENHPFRFRGTFKTSLIKEFVSYINKNCEINTSAVFIDPEKEIAHGIIDFGTHEKPLWRDHVAQLKLKPSPEFKKLIALNNVHLSQEEFIDFCNDHYLNMKFFNENDEAIDFRPSISAIRKLSITETKNNDIEINNFSSSNSALDAIEIKAGGTKPPYSFKFICRPYDSLKPLTLTCQIRAIAKEKTVDFKYRIALLDQTINNVGLEFKTLLENLLDGPKIYTGTMD